MLNRWHQMQISVIFSPAQITKILENQISQTIEN